MATDPKRALRTRLQDVLEERPAELRIAVNGLFVGSQAVSGEVSEQRIKVLIPERIGFVEVFSEFGTCLLYLDVSQPPDGPAEQSVRVPLSDGRHITASLSFDDAAPVLKVVYEDRSVRIEPALAGAGVADASRSLFNGAGAPSGIWRRALAVSVVVLASAIGLWVWAGSSGARVSASELLKDVRSSERAPLAPGVATHRQLTVEERMQPAGRLIRRRRVEVWRDAGRGTQVRRVFDERNHIVGGLWTRSDGSRTHYQAGTPPIVEASAPRTEPIAANGIWQREPSAGDFSALIGSSQDIAIADRPEHYVLTYRADPAPRAGVLEASLTIAKADRRATAETVLLAEDGETHEFSFSETAWETVPSDRLAPEIFEPEAALLAESEAKTLPVTRGASPRLLPSVPFAPPALSARELDKLELDATYRLYRAQIWLDQDARISPTPIGIVVSATVPSADEQAILRRSFEELLANTAVTFDVTVSGGTTGGTVSVPDVAALASVPALPLLEAFFGGKRDAGIDEGIRSFANNILDVSARRRQRLNALNTLLERWPESRLRDLGLESVVTWQLMVQEHADAIRRETQLLMAQIAPVFRIAPPIDRRAPSPPEPLSSVGAAAEAAAQLARSIESQDAALRLAFSPCASGSCALPPANPLMSSCADSVAAAARFTRFYLQLGGK